MIDSTNPRILADNIRELSDKEIIHAAEIGALTSGLEALGSYSTTEIDTGMKYGDDRIYRKIFTLEALPNNDALLVPHGVTNLGQVITLRAIATGVGSGFPIDYRNLAFLSFTSVNIILTTVADYSGQKGLIVFEYTKSAAPSNLASPAPDDTRSIEPEVREEEPEAEPIEEPVVEVKKTTRKKTTTTE